MYRVRNDIQFTHYLMTIKLESVTLIALLELVYPAQLVVFYIIVIPNCIQLTKTMEI